MPPHSTCNSLTLSTDDACTALLGLSTSSFLCLQIIGKYHYSHVVTDQENGLYMEQEARHKISHQLHQSYFQNSQSATT